MRSEYSFSRSIAVNDVRSLSRSSSGVAVSPDSPS
jgi:hypothetical protein